MKRLSGKVAVVTGGSSGIGFATAKAFVNEGATVYITGRRKEALEAAATKIGQGCIPVAGDGANLENIQKLYEQIRSERGRVDIVFANAGIGELASIGQIDEGHAADVPVTRTVLLLTLVIDAAVFPNRQVEKLRLRIVAG